MAELNDSPLVSTSWLAENIDDPGLRIVDVRWHSRYENGKGVSYDDYDGYLEGHIPGAVFAGMISDLSDPDHSVADMLVPADTFEKVMGRLGISNDILVVAYDNMGLPLGSARLWWALSYYGHDKVKVLDGGLRQWVLEGRELSKAVPDIMATSFTVQHRPEWFADKQAAIDGMNDPDIRLIDCLSEEQYSGDEGEHLWGPRSGHIPGAVNVPALANIDPKLGHATSAQRAELLKALGSFTFSSPDVLRELYENAGVKPDTDVITYCGRGFAASCGLLALKVIGHEKVRLYDGSWTEWSADQELPVEKGVPNKV